MEFKLKQWYPTLEKYIKEGSIFKYDEEKNVFKLYTPYGKQEVPLHEVVGNPEFWEAVYKNWTVTSDNRIVFEGDKIYFFIENDYRLNKNFWKKDMFEDYYKVFMFKDKYEAEKRLQSITTRTVKSVKVGEKIQSPVNGFGLVTEATENLITVLYENGVVKSQTYDKGNNYFDIYKFY